MSELFRSQLTIGPLLFHWPADKRRDFYARIADEADVDVVYIGEVVCSKREPFFADDLDPVIRRLARAGKQVVRSTLALMTLDREVKAARELAETGALVEANDVACLQAIGHQPHVIGPYINVFNEDTQDVLIAGGAVRIVYPVEVTAQALKVLTGRSLVESELLVFGRQQLSIAMRCYHARSHGLSKDECQFVCGLDPDGLPAETLDGQGVLTINGTQTLSNGYLVLLQDLAALHRAVLEEKQSPDDAAAALRALTGDVPWQNGFLHSREGLAWIDCPLDTV